MENNNNNGRGIFYGVIGVATLVVTMIGATFAYFSATANSAPNAISANSTILNLTFSQNTTGLKYQLIPVVETTDNFATGGYVGNKNSTTVHDSNCIDDDGNEFCSVYELTITNPSETTAQKVYATFKVAQNTFNVNDNCAVDLVKEGGTSSIYCNKTNFAYAVFKGTANDVISSSTKWDVDGTAVTTINTVTDNTTNNNTLGNVIGTTVVGSLGQMVVGRTPTNDQQTDELDALTQTLKPGGSATYTIVMWLHDPQTDQPDDQGKAFAAGITFSTDKGGTGVTAVLSASNARSE